MDACQPVWTDRSGPEFQSLRSSTPADFCVVGLGGSGLSCISELLNAGADVVGIDAGLVAGGAAGRNGGFLLAGLASFYHQATEKHGRAIARTIYRATLLELERMISETPGLIRRTGSIRLAASEDELHDCRQHADALSADGFEVESYEGPEGRGILLPADGVFDPMARCRHLAQRASNRGARLFEHTPAVEIKPGEVKTPGGSVRCRHVLVLVDGRLETLFPEIAGRVRTARLQMLATKPDQTVHYPRPVYYRNGYEYWQQLPDGRIALGGFRDAGGSAEWTRRTNPTRTIQDRLDRFLRTTVGARAPVTHRWAAPVGYTDTGLPFVRRIRPGISVAGGYCGTGNIIGAICGRGLARFALDGDSSMLTPFGF